MSPARQMSKSYRHEHQWLPFRHRSFSHFMTDTLPSNILVFHLLVTAFTTGVLDATTFADYGVFTSNQTGNAVLLGVGGIGISNISLADVGTSLSSFLVTALICGQIAVRLCPGKGRTRWWTLASSFYQSIVILTLPILLHRRAIRLDRHWSWLVILFLASSAGSQVAMAKQFSIPEIPTAMLTSPFVSYIETGERRKLIEISGRCVDRSVHVQYDSHQGVQYSQE
jgi:uncharacterized membrane protein YoaK (UPF0700 family)